MYRGTNHILLDPKGRIAIPARYRERLAEECAGSMVITLDLFDPCLLLFPLPEWEALEERLAGLSSTNRQHRAIKHILLGHACDVELDRNFRFLIPASLRQRLALDKQLVLVGNGRSFKLWDEARWNEQIDQDLQLVSLESGSDDDLPELSF
jgi:MraZ protein